MISAIGHFFGYAFLTMAKIMERISIVRLFAGLLSFSISYSVLNQYLLIESIIYRTAVDDYNTAIISIFSFAIQSALLFIAVVFLPKRWFIATMVFVAVSAAVNIFYGQILDETIDLSKVSWLLVEIRQAGNAAAEFAFPGFLAFCKLIIAIALMCVARKAMSYPKIRFMRRRLSERKISSLLIIALLVSPSFILTLINIGPEAAERNIFGHLVTIATADKLPDRGEVPVVPQNKIMAKKIIWLIDESVSHEVFSEIIKPNIVEAPFLDFGRTASMGICSTPANVALRSGVDVRQVDSQTDLRATPSIWSYARKAGYETLLIDGQMAGAPQNLLLDPERELIDGYQSMANGIRTDFKIAQYLNGMLKSNGRQFVYAVLRGVHFQYKDHFPKNDLPAKASTMAQYKRAVQYSKQDFFAELFKGVDRSEVAVFYTSDHGQNIQANTLPHCSTRPVEAEFSVPLLAFLPVDVETHYVPAKREGRSASQIFPTTLELMGYARAYAQKNYDNNLASPTAQYVWFGRGVLPVNRGDAIELHKSKDFPGL